MVNILSRFFILFYSILFHCDAAVIPQKSSIQFDDLPYSSNKNAESFYVASLANTAFSLLPSTCTTLGIDSDICETISSTAPSKINIYWAKSETKSGLSVLTNGQSFIGPEYHNVLVLKPLSLSPSLAFIFFFGDRFQHSSCERDHGKITDHGQGKCLISCIKSNNHLNPIRTNICASKSLPSVHLDLVNHQNINLIRCIDGIIGAAPC